MIRTAILIDGAFYRKRAHNLFGVKTPSERALELANYCHRHIKDEKEGTTLYRIFYYDCPPIKDDLFEHIDGIRTKAPKLSVSTTSFP